MLFQPPRNQQGHRQKAPHTANKTPLHPGAVLRTKEQSGEGNPLLSATSNPTLSSPDRRKPVFNGSSYNNTSKGTERTTNCAGIRP